MQLSPAMFCRDNAGLCSQTQLPVFAFLSGTAQSYHGWIWADPANPASLCGHLMSLGSTPLIQSCSSLVRVCLLYYFSTHKCNWRKKRRNPSPQPSVISENVLFPQVSWTWIDQNKLSSRVEYWILSVAHLHLAGTSLLWWIMKTKQRDSLLQCCIVNDKRYKL